MDIIDEQPDEFEAVEQQTPEAPVVEELPEKFRGKTPADLVKMYQEAEKVIGRQGQEVAEVRKLADQLIQRGLQQPASQPKQQADTSDAIDDVDFFADPKSAVAKAVANHPAVRQAQMTAANLTKQESLRNLREKHQDYKEIIADDDFKEWVHKSKVRQQLYYAADRNYDFDAADELFSTFKELKTRKAEATSEEVQNLRSSQERSLKAASNPAVGGSSEPTGKKIYRQAELIQLQIRDPAKYEALQPEIMAAYAEGRVR